LKLADKAASRFALRRGPTFRPGIRPINLGTPFRGPSQYVVASAGASTAPPTLATPVSARASLRSRRTEQPHGDDNRLDEDKPTFRPGSGRTGKRLRLD
jgi:hypothetical protein